MIKINETFYSIQGESSYAGFPTVFIRTSGCHLRCTYCDTTYAYNKGEMMSSEAIIEVIKGHKAKYVCITGGEPLLQKEVLPLMTTLCDMGLKVSLETSGDIDCADVDPRVKKIIDVKTPDSGEPDAFSISNLNFIDMNTEYKFVICSEKDFYWSENFCAKNSLFGKTHVLYSPSFGQVEEKWLAEKILKERSFARLQLQQHKYIWSSTEQGV